MFSHQFLQNSASLFVRTELNIALGFPIGERKEILDVQFGAGALGSREAVGDLDQGCGQACDREGRQVGVAVLVVVEFAEDPADDVDRSAEEALSREVRA